MASLVVAGDTSGSVTLSAPSVSGSTVLTLPTTTGTLVVTGGAQTIEFADGSAAAPSITNSGDTNTGIFFPAADTIAFTEGGTESMRVNSSGNLGIGTTSPSARLHVTQVGNPIAQFTRSDSGTGLVIASDSDGPYFRPETSSAIRFNNSANTVENMRVTANGELLVGTTSGTGATERFALVQDNANWVHTLRNSSASQPYGSQIWYTGSDPNNTSNFFFGCYGGGAQTLRLNIRSNGGIANYSGNNVNLSDAREKTNVELAGSYLDKICAIPVKTFNYIDQNREEDDGLTLGVIAQDVQAVAPELVMESNWAAKDEPEKMRLSIYQTDLQYALMKSIQELNAKVEAQAVRIAELEGAK